MATTSSNVRVAVTGGVYVAPTGTTLPTNSTSSLNVAFDEVGYLSEDGITQSIAADITEIKAWQNADVVRKIQTSHDVTYQFSMIETSPTTLETFFGNYTGNAAAGSLEITGEQLPHLAWVIHVIDGDARIRLVVPDGQITERGDVAYVNGEQVSYPVTISAFPVDGVKAFEYFDADVSS